MATIKLPGVYMIRNKNNNKVYIGQSSDIRNRWKRYRWAVNSDKSYDETTRPVVLAMRAEGIENFEFSIICSNNAMQDKLIRLAVEEEYIMKYQSYDNRYGYNISAGNEPYIMYRTNFRREQKTVEKMNRANPVFLFDITNRNTLLYLSGAKGIGDDLGYDKDVMSHSIKRGSLINKRYYIIPADYKARHELLEKLRVKKTQNTDQSTRAQSHSANTFAKYELVVSYIDLVAIEFGYGE